MENTKIGEDKITNVIEKQTVKLPSDTFLFSALGAAAVSLAFKLTGKDRNATFIGQWVAPILIMGVYNKLVKQQKMK